LPIALFITNGFPLNDRGRTQYEYVSAAVVFKLVEFVIRP
jgi:hypothetical protein